MWARNGERVLDFSRFLDSKILEKYPLHEGLITQLCLAIQRIECGSYRKVLNIVQGKQKERACLAAVTLKDIPGQTLFQELQLLAPTAKNPIVSRAYASFPSPLMAIERGVLGTNFDRALDVLWSESDFLFPQPVVVLADGTAIVKKINVENIDGKFKITGCYGDLDPVLSKALMAPGEKLRLENRAGELLVFAVKKAYWWKSVPILTIPLAPDTQNGEFIERCFGEIANHYSKNVSSERVSCLILGMDGAPSHSSKRC